MLATNTERRNWSCFNRLNSTIANLDQIRVNSSSRGRIVDTDFAEETANLAKGQIPNRLQPYWRKQMLIRVMCFLCYKIRP